MLHNYFLQPALILQALIIISPSSAHSRWKCPSPRSPSTGIKNGPCGSDTNSFETNVGTDSPIIEIAPGPFLVTFEESIHHTGAPFRISLSPDGHDGNDGSSNDSGGNYVTSSSTVGDTPCILLDHIPHNDCCKPSLNDPSSYTPYSITVYIPNVNCERCSLHLTNPMTDKIGSDGSPSGVGCTYDYNVVGVGGGLGGTCFSVYHSCTVPFRIVGAEGAVDRSNYECGSGEGGGVDEDLSQWRNSWPRDWTGDGGATVDASVPGVYRRESWTWSEDNHTLMDVPYQYRQDAGGICSEKKEAQFSNTDSSLENEILPLIQTDYPTLSPTTKKSFDIQPSGGPDPNSPADQSDLAKGESPTTSPIVQFQGGSTVPPSHTTNPSTLPPDGGDNPTPNSFKAERSCNGTGASILFQLVFLSLAFHCMAF